MHQSGNLASSLDENNKKISDLEAKWKDMPDKYFIVIAQFLAGYINDTDAYERYNGPILKSSIKSVYWIFLVQYALLAAAGIVMNVAIIAYVLYHKLYKDVTHAFIMNLAVCHFVQCAIVLPITLMVMLIQNWIYGQFLCFFLPMLQDIPLHVAMISHILIAWDRMRWLGDPMKGRLPAFVCCCTTWLTGMVIALPYPIYTIYVEIGDYVPRLNGIGLCVVNLMDDMHEYMRGLFLIMYCGPTVLLAYFYIRTSQELHPPDGRFAVMMFEQRADIRSRQGNSSASSVDRSLNTTTGIGSSLTTTATATAATTTLGRSATATALRSYDLYNAELDVSREKRKQRNFGSMAAAQVVCICPLMILRLARMVMEETYDNTKHFDFTFLMFVWIAFLPTVIFPCIYASQILPRNEQKRLRGYFRLSGRRFKKSHSVADSGHSPESRQDSIEKDENTNSTLRSTSIIPNSDGGGGCFDGDFVNGGKILRTKNKISNSKNLRSESSQQLLKTKQLIIDTGGGAGDGIGEGKCVAGERVGVNEGDSKKDDIQINVISNGSAKLNMSSVGRLKKSVVGLAGQQRPPLANNSLDNNSCSNVTSSTYCNGNSSLIDGDVSNFGDGEDSSIVSGMLVQINGGQGGSSAYYDKKWSNGALVLRQKDVSFSDSGSFTRMDSSSTLERDLEIIDLLERERSMDLQEMLECEKRGEPVRHLSERRRLPDIEKIYKSPKPKLETYSYEASAATHTANTSQTSTASAKETLPVTKNLESSNGTYGDVSSLRDDEVATHMQNTLREGGDEDVPADFFDQYPPDGTNGVIGGVTATTTPAPPYQYQYSRRLSRKPSSLHNQSSHRASKRENFNSLNGSDLIAGAFGELDPTQPLSKMSVIENRMRRSSGRTSSFSSSGRSSMKSRDFNHGSMHSAHPELDFRENIFAEL